MSKNYYLQIVMITIIILLFKEQEGLIVLIKRWKAMLLVLVFAAAGCSGKQVSSPGAADSGNHLPESSNTVQPQHNSDSRNEARRETKTTGVTDVTGTRLELPDKVSRVACLTEICVDSLAELGLEPAAVTVGGISSLPEFFGNQAENFNKIGGSFLEPNLEDIAKAQPDLVIGLEGTHEGLRDGLREIAPLYITQPKTYQDSIAFLEMMGELTGRTTEADEAKKKLLDKLNFYITVSPKDKSALIMYGSDVNFGIDTEGSLVGSMITEITEYPWPAPVENGGHQAGGMTYSLEKVLETDPDWLFIETFSFGPDSQPLSEQFMANPLWAKLKAVREGQVQEVRTSIWASGRGTRSLGIILDEAMQTLYPDIDKEAGTP